MSKYFKKIKKCSRKGLRSLGVMLLLSTAPASAQSTLIDYDSTRVDLGFGVVQQKLLSTVAMSTISGDELRKTSAYNLREALYAQLPGLTVLNHGGFAARGKDTQISIRGDQTTGDKNILILVDGIERNIDYMTTDEVESVTVLRDAAAVALLGYQGVNGALLITTKRGKAGKLRVNASYDHKFTFDPKTADFVGAYDYANALNKARANDGLSPAYNDYELNAFRSGLEPYYYPHVNWKDEAFKSLGSEDKLNLEANGGNDKLQYEVLLGLTNVSGLLGHTDVSDDYSAQLKGSRGNILTNIDAELSKTTHLRVNVDAGIFETNQPNDADGNEVTRLLYAVPSSAFPVTNDPDGVLAGVWGGNTTYTGNNVMAKIMASGYMKSHGHILQGDVTLTQKLDFWLKGLSVSARVGYSNYEQIFENNKLGYEYGYERYGFDANGIPTSLTSYKAGDKTSRLAFAYGINEHRRSSYLALKANYATKFRADDNFIAALIWHQKNTTPNGQYNTFNRMDWQGYLHYDLKQRYIADLVLALNGSNRSYPNKWAFAPTLSLGYILKNAPEAKGLNLAKFRLSGGIQHSDYVPVNGLWLENYGGGGGDYYFGIGTGSQNWGTFISYLPNDDLSHETAYKFNLGGDFRLARQLDLNVDLYYQLRDNIILSDAGFNSSVMGLPASYMNYGRVASYGVEFSTNWVRTFHNGLSTHIGGNFSWGRNNIRRTIESKAYDYLSSVGGRVNQAWGLQVIGFFKDQDDIDNSPEQNFDNTKPGDFKYKDQNNDNVINEDDVVKLGYDTSVPEINFAINLGLKYKNVGFDALFQGATNYTQYLGTAGVWVPLVDGANLTQDYYDKCWDNSNHPKYPRLTSRTNNNNYRANSTWYKDITFLKLRSARLYYDLPKTFIQKLSLVQAQLYVKGENLLTISNCDVMDPENIGTNYPALRGIDVGISVKF